MESGLDECLDDTLLYDLICESAPAVEHQEIKRVLGAAMVEENADLMLECTALSEILEGYEAETKTISDAKNKSQAFLMPDRERLLNNIKFFVGNIQRAGTPLVAGGRPRSTPQALLQCNSESEQKVIEYVNSELNRTISADGSDTPRLAGSLRPSSRSGPSDRPRTAPARGDAVLAKAGVLKISQVKEQLRELLTEENQALKTKSEALRLQIEDGIDDRDRIETIDPPSLAEIKQLEGKLEMISCYQPMAAVPSMMLPTTRQQEPPAAVPTKPATPKKKNTSSPKTKTRQSHGDSERPPRPKSKAAKAVEAAATEVVPNILKSPGSPKKKPLAAKSSTLVLDCSGPAR